MKQQKRKFNMYGVAFVLLLIYFIFHQVLEGIQYNNLKTWLIEAALIIPAIVGIIFTLKNPKEFLKVGK